MVQFRGCGGSSQRDTRWMLHGRCVVVYSCQAEGSNPNFKSSNPSKPEMQFFFFKAISIHTDDVIFQQLKETNESFKVCFKKSDIQPSRQPKNVLPIGGGNVCSRPERCQEQGCNLIWGWAFKSSQASSVWKTALSGPAWWAPSLCHCHLASALACQIECHPRTGCEPPYETGC